MYVMCYECVFRVNFVMFRPCKYNMKSDSLKVNKVFRWCAHHIYSLASGFEEKSRAVGSKTISTCSSFINIRKTTYSTYKLMHVQLVLSLIIILTTLQDLREIRSQGGRRGCHQAAQQLPDQTQHFSGRHQERRQQEALRQYHPLHQSGYYRYGGGEGGA